MKINKKHVLSFGNICQSIGKNLLSFEKLNNVSLLMFTN
jgi:hypothetical protein